MVDCPEVKQPTAFLPFFAIAALNFSAIVLKATSQLTGWNSPSLAYLPSFILNIG